MEEEKVKHFCYMLRCNDGSLYTGYTTDPKRRILEHNTSDKGAKYTRTRRPCELVHCEEFADRSSAQKREAAIKKMSKKQKEMLVNDLK